MTPASFLLAAMLTSAAPARAQQEPAVLRDISLAGYCDQPGIIVDLAVPTGGKPGQRFPALLLVHGGAWISDTRSDLEAFFRELPMWRDPDNFVPFVVANLDYRLARPLGVKIPDQISDVQCAVRWLKDLAANPYSRIDSARIGVLGLSAGGHLALMTAFGSGRNSVQAVVAWSAVSDLEDFYWYLRKFNGPNADLIFRQALWGPPTGDQLPAVQRISPRYLATHGAPVRAPVLLTHGANDDVVPKWESENMDQAIRKAGGRSTLVLLPGGGHGAYQQAETWQANWFYTLDFLRRELRAQAESPLLSYGERDDL